MSNIAEDVGLSYIVGTFCHDSAECVGAELQLRPNSELPGLRTKAAPTDTSQHVVHTTDAVRAAITSSCALFRIRTWHMTKRLPPGTPAPASGQYGLIGPRGGDTGQERTATRGEPLPPTPKPGMGYVMNDPTKNGAGRGK